MKEVHVTGNPTEEEMAACLAALYILLSEADTGHDCATITKASTWGRASQMEQTRGALVMESSCTRRQSLWGLGARTARKFLSLALLTIVAAAQPVRADDRLQGGPDRMIPGRPETTRSQPAGVLQAPEDQSEVSYSRQPIRVVLSPATTTVDISLPDGAEIVDLETNELVAQLPPCSSWNVSIRASSSARKLCFSGTIGNHAFRRVVVDRSLSPYRTAAYHYDKPGFQPLVLDNENPLFAINLKPTTGSLTGYQPVGYMPSAGGHQTGISTGSQVPSSPGRSFIVRPLRADGILALGARGYRGQFLLRAKPGTDQLAVINHVDMEEYLLSVVPAEMPGSWSLEALKAQAIAARSYAMANLGKHAGEGWDVTATVEDQVYAGIQSETDNSNSAVAQTRGLVIKHQGAVVSAFFHSAGGGCTELAEHVWGKSVPYLKSVVDYDDRSPHFEWTRQFRVLEAEECLKKAGKDVGSLLAILPVVRTASGRLKSAMIIGSQGPLLVSGEELRKVFSLPSSLFNACIDNECYVFAGRGHGHGLGMSQWGARTLADQGYNAAQILAYYYKDISIDPL